MTLTEFLLARIAEDEEVAQAAGSAEWASLNRSWDVERVRDIADVTGVHERLFPAPMGYDEHIARHDPARVLAECEAKRRIVEQYEEYRSSVMAYRSPRWKDAMNEQDKQEWRKAEARHRVAEDILRLLALPYADHEDFQEEWRV